MSKSPKDKVDEFLDSPDAKRHRGGAICRTCQHPNCEEINEMLRYFEEQRAAGRTTVPWRSFVQHRIIRDPDYALTIKWRALLKHAEDCLELPLS